MPIPVQPLVPTMTTQAPINMSKLLNQLAQREYDDKSAQEELCFIAAAQVYHTVLTNQGVTADTCWIVILKKLTEGAAAWAGPHIIQVATGTAMPWADYAAFETDFKAHFCAA